MAFNNYVYFEFGSLSAIISVDEEELEDDKESEVIDRTDMSDIASRFPFSPLVVAVLDTLEHNNMDDGRYCFAYG